MRTEAEQCGDVTLLIPWYVNGTLDQPERLEIEQLRDACPTCAREIREQTQLASVLARIPDDETAAARSWASLSVRITADERQCARRSGGTLSRIAEWVRAHWGGLAGLSLAASVATLALAIMLQPEPQTTASYETLTTPTPSLAGPSIRVKVAENVPEEAFGEIATGLGLTVHEGSSTRGIYTVVPSEDADLDSIAAALRAHPEVLLVRVRSGG